MKNKIILSAIFLIAGLVNMHVFTDVFGDTAIPKARIFGTTTVFADSTNYVTLNKGYYVRDSLKTDKDLIVKGAVVLDTLRLGKIQYRGNGIYLSNDKVGGNMTFQLMDDAPGGAGDFTWLFGNYLSGQTGMTLDSTSGLTVSLGNIQLSGTTQQIKIPSDTASDYDGNNSITLNRQSGKIITKSLTTAAGGGYSIALVNSLVTTSSRIVALVQYGYGTNTIAPCIVADAVITSAGNAAFSIYNLSGSSLNGSVGISFIIFN